MAAGGVRQRTAWDSWRWKLISDAGKAKTNDELAELYLHLANNGPAPNDQARDYWRMAAQRAQDPGYLTREPSLSVP